MRSSAHWTATDLVLHGALLVTLGSLCFVQARQSQQILFLGDRIDEMSERVTTANLQAWKPWSEDVTATIHRIEWKLDLLRGGGE